MKTKELITLALLAASLAGCAEKIVSQHEHDRVVQENHVLAAALDAERMRSRAESNRSFIDGIALGAGMTGAVGLLLLVSGNPSKRQRPPTQPPPPGEDGKRPPVVPVPVEMHSTTTPPPSKATLPEYKKSATIRSSAQAKNPPSPASGNLHGHLLLVDGSIRSEWEMRATMAQAIALMDQGATVTIVFDSRVVDLIESRLKPEAVNAYRDLRQTGVVEEIERGILSTRRLLEARRAKYVGIVSMDHPVQRVIASGVASLPYAVRFYPAVVRGTCLYIESLGVSAVAIPSLRHCLARIRGKQASISALEREATKSPAFEDSELNPS